MKHYFSEPGTWKVTVEFVDSKGNVMNLEGESVISMDETGITNTMYVASEKINRRNEYRITNVSATEMAVESTDSNQPRLSGKFNVERNNLFFKYRIDETATNGYEILSRHQSVSYAYGALYDGDTLLGTWTAISNKL